MLSASCVPKYYAVFINSTDQCLSVKLISVGGGYEFRAFSIDAGQTYRSEIMFVEAEVFAQNGNSLFSKQIPPIDYDGYYESPKDRTFYFLLTETDIYEIPIKYQTDWKNSINEIVNYNERIRARINENSNRNDNSTQ